MRARYYWPNLFKDAHAWARKCKQCALFFWKGKVGCSTLASYFNWSQPFLNWGINFVGPINLNSSAGLKWILTTTNYFTCWMKEKTLKEANEAIILNFYDDLICRFGVADSIIFDNALEFVGARITKWALRNGVYLNTSSNYYPQGKGLA